jgi:DNA-binding transcriptional LysR family regulator
MTYDQLVTLDSIVKQGSFKAAAEFLSKSQPSLSVAIKKLEEEFEIQLFSREQYRPKLTPCGEAFYKKAKVALEQFNELEVFAKELGMGAEAEINLSLDAICPLSKISNVLQSFFDPHISTSLNLSIDILEGLMEKVIQGKVDFAIGSYFEEHDDIEAIRIFCTTMVPVIASDFYNRYEGDLDDLKSFPQIIVQSSASNSNKKIVGAVSGMKQWFTSDMSMKEQLIANGLGWGRLPLHQVQSQLESGTLAEVKTIAGITRLDVPMYLLRSKKKVMGPNSKRLWNYLSEIKA